MVSKLNTIQEKERRLLPFSWDQKILQLLYKITSSIPLIKKGNYLLC